jgi:hypothetical protein
MPSYSLPATRILKNVEVFRVGKWNGGTFTLEDLKGMAEAFAETKSAVMPFLKLGHGNSQDILKSDGLPAAGWVDDLRLVNDTLVADFSGIPAKVYDLLERGAYRARSIEIWRDVKIAGKTHKWLMTAVAFLGAELPAVDGLNDILNLFAANGGEALTFEAAGEPLRINLGGDDVPEGKKMDIETLKAALAVSENKLVEANAKAETFEKAAKDGEQAVIAAKAETAKAIGERDAAQAQVAEFAKKATEAEVNTELDKLVREKRITPAQKPALFALMAASSGDGSKYTFGDKKDLSMRDALREFVTNGSKVEMTDEEETESVETDNGSTNASAKLHKAASAHIEKMKSEGKSVSFKDALLYVAAKAPKAKDEDGAE